MERIKKLQTPILILIIILIIFIGWWALNRYQKVFKGSFSASGTVEATEISIAAELSGKVQQVFVEEGQSVKAGEPLFALDDTLLAAQRQKANAAYLAAQANLKVAQSGLASAKSNLELAQANYDLVQTQYQITVENVRRADEKQRAAYWHELVPYQFNLPVWYFDKQEQIKAAEAEVEAAKSALDQEQADYIALLKKYGYEDLIKAEERLARARISFDVANEVLNRAKAANDDDGDGEEETTPKTETWVIPSPSGGYQTKNLPITYSLPNDHWDNDTFEAAEDALQDSAQAARDKAKAELDAAQQDYKSLLSKLKITQEIKDARANLAIAIERYELAQDRLMELHSGSNSLQIIAAQDTLRQAEATLKQAQDGLTQA
ncbi:MAG: biotin/lipoyl-binding protein, partial [Anaerolineales bacterium]